MENDEVKTGVRGLVRFRVQNSHDHWLQLHLPLSQASREHWNHSQPCSKRYWGWLGWKTLERNKLQGFASSSHSNKGSKGSKGNKGNKGSKGSRGYKGCVWEGLHAVCSGLLVAWSGC